MKIFEDRSNAPTVTILVLCRPSVVVSYAVGAVTAGLAATAYCELGTALPLAGASFNYVLATFGEFPAWYAHFLSWKGYSIQSKPTCILQHVMTKLMLIYGKCFN